MRLSADQLKQAICHPDQDVREAVIFYFARSFTADETVLPLVIEAIERYGRVQAFPFYTFMANLPLNDATLPWLLSELSHGEEEVDGYFECLVGCLSSADPSLLKHHQATIMEMGSLLDDDRDAIAERIWLFTRSPDELWHDLEEFCVAQVSEPDDTDVDVGFACRLVSALAQHRDEFVERVLNLLAIEVEDDADDPMIWMEPLAIRLVGEMRLHEAMPLIIDRLGEDDDFIHEETNRALIRIGTDEVVNALASKFVTANQSFQLSVCFVLEFIHTDLSAAKSLELFEHSHSTEIQACMLSAALLNFTAEAIEPARQFVLSTPLDPDVIDVRLNLLIASDVLGLSFPEKETWREARKGDQEFRRKWNAEHYGTFDSWDEDDEESSLEVEHLDDLPPGPPMTIHNEGAKVGRNDPCPCGSGKKYKKCCLKKLKENPLWN